MGICLYDNVISYPDKYDEDKQLDAKNVKSRICMSALDVWVKLFLPVQSNFNDSTTLGTMKICSRQAIQMSTHNIPFLNIKKKIILNHPKSATLEFVPRDPRTSSNQPW